MKDSGDWETGRLGTGDWGLGRHKDAGTRRWGKITNYQLPITNYQLPIPHSPFPIPHSPFPIPNIKLSCDQLRFRSHSLSPIQYAQTEPTKRCLLLPLSSDRRECASPWNQHLKLARSPKSYQREA